MRGRCCWMRRLGEGALKVQGNLAAFFGRRPANAAAFMCAFGLLSAMLNKCEFGISSQDYEQLQGNLTPAVAREILRDKVPLEQSVAKACGLSQVSFVGADLPISPSPDFGVKEYILRSMLVYCRVYRTEHTRRAQGNLAISIDRTQNKVPRLSNVIINVSLEGAPMPLHVLQKADVNPEYPRGPLPKLFFYPKAIVHALGSGQSPLRRHAFFDRICSKSYKIPNDNNFVSAFSETGPTAELPLAVHPKFFGGKCTIPECGNLITGGPRAYWNKEFSVVYLFSRTNSDPDGAYAVRTPPTTFKVEPPYIAPAVPGEQFAKCSAEDWDRFAALQERDPSLARTDSRGQLVYQPFCGLGSVQPLLQEIPIYDDVECSHGGSRCELRVTQSWIKENGNMIALTEAYMSDGRGVHNEKFGQKVGCASRISQSF